MTRFVILKNMTTGEDAAVNPEQVTSVTYGSKAGKPYCCIYTADSDVPLTVAGNLEDILGALADSFTRYTEPVHKCCGKGL